MDQKAVPSQITTAASQSKGAAVGPKWRRGGQNLGNLLSLIAGVLSFADWRRHLYTCFNEKLWGFLIANAPIFPIAII